MAKIKSNYYELSENQIIYHAGFWKRFFARLFDFVLAMIIPSIISFVIFHSQLNKVEYPKAWNGIFLLSNILSISLIIIVFFIIPVFNKKNPGQTLGKKIFKITILYFDENKVLKSIFLREMLLTVLFLIPIVFKLIGGFESNQMISIFKKQNPDSHSVTFFTFLFNKWLKGDVTKGLKSFKCMASCFSYYCVSY